MMDPTFLSESWLEKDAAIPAAPAYYTPAMIRRALGQTAQGDSGMQIALIPEGDGFFGLSRIDFTLPSNGRIRMPEETITPLATHLRAGEAMTRAFALMGQEFEAVKRCRDSVPQALKISRPPSFCGAEPLAKLPAILPPHERAGFEPALQRLSSQWGKKTSPYRELPRPKRLEIGAFSF